MNTKQPVRLYKADQDNFSSINRSQMNAWLQGRAFLYFILLTILISLIFVVLCYTLLGVTSATESGTVYNQFNRII